MKKSQLLGMGVALGAALCSTALLSSSVNADVYNWVANTPSQIAPLNNNGTYTVRKGDTLWAIGMHYNIKPWSIAQWNNITDPYTLQIGTVLKLNVNDNGNKATLTIQNGNTNKKIPLTSNDKWDPKKSFGTQLNSNDKAVQQTQTTTNNVNNKANTTVKNNSVVQNNTQNKVATSLNHQNNNQQNTPQPNNFPANMQGTWYGYNQYTNSLDTVIFKGNTISFNGGTPGVAYKITPELQSQISIGEVNPQAIGKTIPSRPNWITLSYIEGWANTRGWYQGAGDGDFYKVVNENINGQSTPVLEHAAGAGIWVDQHFYRTPQLAWQQMDTNYPGDNLRQD